jgi:hypothetical protein
MRNAMAFLLGMLLPILGLADLGLAQSAVQLQGTIESVDCQSQTVVLTGSSGSNTVAATAATAVLVNSASVPFCALQQYVGAPAAAWVIPDGNEIQVTRIDVAGPATEAPAPAPAATASSPSPLGIVLGALAVGTLGYILGRASAVQPYNQPVYQVDRGRWVTRGGGGGYVQQCGHGNNQLCRGEPSSNK